MVAFLGQMLRDYRSTGAVAPSGSALAKSMTKTLRADNRPKRLLEVGPGTGPFTRFMLQALRPGDELHLVEISPAFAKRLEVKLLAPYRRKRPNVVIKLHCASIETVELPGTFDYIVCGLPFNNFPPQMVRKIFRRLIDLLDEGGELAYFSYAGAKFVKAPLVGIKGRRKIKSMHATEKILRRRHQGRRELVLGNFPPAVTVRLTR